MCDEKMLQLQRLRTNLNIFSRWLCWHSERNKNKFHIIPARFSFFRKSYPGGLLRFCCTSCMPNKANGEVITCAFKQKFHSVASITRPRAAQPYSSHVFTERSIWILILHLRSWYRYIRNIRPKFILLYSIYIYNNSQVSTTSLSSSSRNNEFPSQGNLSFSALRLFSTSKIQRTFRFQCQTRYIWILWRSRCYSRERERERKGKTERELLFAYSAAFDVSTTKVNRKQSWHSIPTLYLLAFSHECKNDEFFRIFR